jgi:hypothetical protein
MDAKPCQDYCCSSFATFQDEQITRTPDLTNPIHQIFRRSNFTNISQRDYDLLRPSLQLASLLLQSDALIPFILTIVDGEIHLGNGTPIPYSLMNVQDTDADFCLAWDIHAAPRAGQTEINAQNRQRVSQILAAMADMIELRVGDVCPEDEVAPNTSGYAAKLDGCLTRPLQQTFPRGCSSRIFVNAHMLSWLKCMTTQDAVNRSKSHCDGCTPSKRLLNSEHLTDERSCWRCFVPFYLLTWRYHLAETFVHEFGHALHNAAYGWCRDLRLAPGSIGEAGYEICSQLFGGILEIAPDQNGGLPLDLVETTCNGNKPRPIGPFGILTEWPSTGMAEKYSADGVLIKPLSFNPDHDVIHRIPFSYFEDLFSATFWERVSREGAQALKPPNMGTWCFRWQQSPVQRYYCCTAEQHVKRLVASKTSVESGLSSVSDPVIQTTPCTGANDCSKIAESKCKCLGKRKRRLSSLGMLERNDEFWYDINGVAVLQ